MFLYLFHLYCILFLLHKSLLFLVYKYYFNDINFIVFVYQIFANVLSKSINYLDVVFTIKRVYFKNQVRFFKYKNYSSLQLKIVITNFTLKFFPVKSIKR